MTPTTKHAVCSFCGVGPEKTAKLIAGPGAVSICAECVHLCAEILEDVPPAPSLVQQATLVLEDGSSHLVAMGLREAVSMLGADDSRIVAFDLVVGGRFAVRRQAVRQVRADSEPAAEPRERPAWAGHQPT